MIRQKKGRGGRKEELKEKKIAAIFLGETKNILLG